MGTRDEAEIAQKTVERLSEKSLEAFLLAIELYNRPSIKYHAEGCAFFITNAWELLLKAYLVKTEGIASIYYRDSPNRTISLKECASHVMTNSNDPIRVNL